jgi:hypothetical protein
MDSTDPAEIEHRVMYRIANAPVRNWPFPHLLVEDVFPADFYARLLNALPPLESYRSIADAGRVAQATPDAYRQRHTIDLTRPEPERFPPAQREFWTGLLGWLVGERFTMFALQQFGALVGARFGDRLGDARFHPEFQLIRDFTDYSLGPHTDSPHKVVVLLFYLPRTAEREALGTSLYVPREPAFRCDGTRHHAREQFLRVATLPYRPNSMMAFFKSARSFHGVERVNEPEVRRDLIQLSLCHRMVNGPGFAAVPQD